MKMYKSIREAYRRSTIFDKEKDTCFGRCLKWSIKIWLKINIENLPGFVELATGYGEKIEISSVKKWESEVNF